MTQLFNTFVMPVALPHFIIYWITGEPSWCDLIWKIVGQIYENGQMTKSENSTL